MFDLTAEAKTTSTQFFYHPTSTETIHYLAVNNGKPVTRVVTSLVLGDLVQHRVYSLADGSYSTSTTTFQRVLGATAVPSTSNAAAPRATGAAAAIFVAGAVMGAAALA